MSIDLVMRSLLSRFSGLRHRSTFARSTTTKGANQPLVVQIWGSGTNVGKTVLSAGLLQNAERPSLYIKPVQTGNQSDGDAKKILLHAPEVHSITLHAYADGISPDLAARRAGVQPPSDEELCSSTERILVEYKRHFEEQSDSKSIALVETAGGVLSPTPSGGLQADAFRPLRLPSVLLGDARLGGISATLAAYEALCLRGYDTPAIVLFAEQTGLLDNESSIQPMVNKETSVFRAPSLPSVEVPLQEYLEDGNTKEFFMCLHDHLRCTEAERLKTLQDMKEESKQVFWYPFTQHTQLGTITCIDSAYGSNYMVHDDKNGVQPMVDAIGSWWTNGVGHGDSKVAKAIGAAAGRYGHVMFAEGTYQPAFQLAKKVLNGPGAGWASRVFFSDNGSTGVEVALKMAFRKRAMDASDRNGLPVRIVGLAGSYHGDTLGAMNCAADSDYNRMQTPWYEPRGLFFDPPIVSIQNGIWVVDLPEWLQTDFDIELEGKEELFCNDRKFKPYTTRIAETLDAALNEREADIGALIMEPIFLAAGGMKIVDPAFQRSLIDECRKRGIPVVFDEIFTGFWRLGVESAAELLGRTPDIAAFGKLLTGGTVPLTVTMASNDIFEAFKGSSKKEALLHGHSYTAHAIGCAAGVESIERYEKHNDKLAKSQVREHWSEELAREISTYDVVNNVTVLGTVLSINLKAKDGYGYAATGASEITKSLREENIFVRPLGNVIYVMCTPLCSEEVCNSIAGRLVRVLDNFKPEIPTSVST